MRHIKHYPTKRTRLYPLGLHWTHATKSGGAVLRSEVSWKNINGVWIGTPKHRLFIMFRRVA